MVVSSICPNLSKRAIPEGEYYSSILNCINGYVNIHMGKPLYEQALSENVNKLVPDTYVEKEMIS